MHTRHAMESFQKMRGNTCTNAVSVTVVRRVCGAVRWDRSVSAGRLLCRNGFVGVVVFFFFFGLGRFSRGRGRSCESYERNTAGSYIFWAYAARPQRGRRHLFDLTPVYKGERQRWYGGQARVRVVGFLVQRGGGGGQGGRGLHVCRRVVHQCGLPCRRLGSEAGSARWRWCRTVGSGVLGGGWVHRWVRILTTTTEQDLCLDAVGVARH